MLNGALKIVKLIFMRNFEKPWVICCETEGELEVFPLLVLCQTKPVYDRNTLKTEAFGNQRIDVRAHATLQRTEVDDASTVINKLREIVDGFPTQGIESDVELVSTQGFAYRCFPIAIAG